MRHYYILLLSVLFFTTTAQSQLAGFNLNVTKTDETCLGNGTLTFSVSNTTPNSSVLYKVYYLPDTTNPFTVLTGNNLGSLTSGTYKVVAIQSLGDLSNSQEQTVSIENMIIPFNFEVVSSTQSCTSGGSLIVNSLSGTAVQFEIISGPETRSLQSSNIFSDLPSGTYNVRAYNNCGVAKVRTYTLSNVNNTLAISGPVYPEMDNLLCDSITVNNIITATSGTISYPVSVQHTLAPLSIGGDEIIINQVFATGSPSSLEVSAVMPRYISESYSYNLDVTDNCNVTYQKSDNVVDPTISATLSTADAPCAEKYLKLKVLKYTTSYTVNFISVPEGFDPADFNSTPFGPFTENSVSYGNEENPVPFGVYTVEVTDACGRVTTYSLSVEFIHPEATVASSNNGCFSEFGKIRMSVPPQKLVSATIISAPASYTASLPQDVTANITEEGKLELNNMPLGTYVISFVDNCGFEYTEEVEVPPYVERPFEITALPSCEPHFGTVHIKSGNGHLTQVLITAAPSSLGQPLPYDVSANITASGQFYMDSLPQGNYTFTATDVCGIVKPQQIAIEGYTAPADAVSYTANCGSFSVLVSDDSNGIQGAGYWLQHYNEFTATWEHPFYEIPYVEGTVPGTTTGISLTNNVERNNLNYTGKFRVVKKFESFGNGTAENTICVSVLDEFIYTEELYISAAYNLACIGQPNSVLIEPVGNPVSYKIKEKNGEPFVVDNGNNNIFTDLEPAEYLFVIEDACGNIDRQGFNVQSLPSLAQVSNPSDMVICTEPGTVQNHEFHLTDQNADVLGTLYSALYTVTYHLTQEDADNGTNALPEYYTNTSNGQVIYVRLVHNVIAICHGTTSFQLFIGEYQEPEIASTGTICNEGAITLNAGLGYSTYLWSTGETTRTIVVSEPGDYTVIVQKAYGDTFCDGFAEVHINASEAPSIVKVETSDWTRDNNTITIYTEGAGTYEYSVDGVNYQAENVFTGLGTGVYQVYVRDVYGCGKDIRQVVLMDYPNFFTPNGDGVHDKWRIEYAVLEPHMHINIFDRYGKLVSSFGATSEGWDGNFNGLQLPATDYWFVVTREDGRELKGHFSMLR
jgi:gliding motility-associated-like protein